MEVKQQETESKGSFFMEVDRKVLAEMAYSKAGTERIIIDHTEVSDELRGQGAGAQLVAAGKVGRYQNSASMSFCQNYATKAPRMERCLVRNQASNPGMVNRKIANASLALFRLQTCVRV